MNSKKDDLFFIIKLGIYFFAFLMILSYIFLKIMDVEFIRTEYIGQILFVILFLALGSIIGLTDCIFKISSSKLKGIITGVTFYIISLILFKFVPFNPLQNVIIFFVYTVFFFLLFFVIHLCFKYFQELESKKYEKYINLLKEKKEN